MRFRGVDWRLILFLTMSVLGAVVLCWAFASAVGSSRGFGFDARAYC